MRITVLEHTVVPEDVLWEKLRSHLSVETPGLRRGKTCESQLDLREITKICNLVLKNTWQRKGRRHAWGVPTVSSPGQSMCGHHKHLLSWLLLRISQCKPMHSTKVQDSVVSNLCSLCFFATSVFGLRELDPFLVQRKSISMSRVSKKRK